MSDAKNKKADKAARRAATLAARGGAPEASPSSAAPATAASAEGPPPPSRRANPVAKGASQDGAKGKAAPSAVQQSTSAALPATVTLVAAPDANPLQPFLHLDAPLPSTSLSHSSKINTTQLHPAVITLALQYAEFRIVGANARCIAMLDAFKELLRTYSPPPQTNFSRHFPTYLSPHISHLRRARPLSVSMANAIRYLKYEVSLIDMDSSESDAKAVILGKIDAFVRDRILLADQVIQQHAISKIKDEGDVVLTYARSSIAEGVLLRAWQEGKRFKVVAVDAKPLYEGRNLTRSLTAAGIPVTYVLLPALSSALPSVTLCLLGTHSLLSNGSMFARAGTASVAMMAKERGVPVIVCCETYKFSERVMLDSIVGNERADPSPLLEGLPEGTEQKNLYPLSLLYDVSLPGDVTAVITEAGILPPESVPMILRDYKPFEQ